MALSPKQNSVPGAALDVQAPATLSRPWQGPFDEDDHHENDDHDHDVDDHHDDDHDVDRRSYPSCLDDLTSSCPALEGTVLKKTKKLLVRFFMMTMIMFKMTTATITSVLMIPP